MKLSSMISFTCFENDRPFVLKFLALFLGAVLIIGVFSHYTGLGSDPYGVVHFAQHLARGKFYSDFPVYGWFKPDWKTGSSMVLYGNYQLSNGKMFCKYTIGYSLLLAVSLKLFGPSSIYIFNVFILVLLLLFQYLLAREVLPSRPHRDLLALCAPLLLLLLIDKVWQTAIKPVHDLPALMILVAGIYLWVRALKSPARIGWWLLGIGSFCLGFSGSFRLPNVLIVIPAGVYLLVRLIGKVRIGKIGLVLAVAALAFALGLLPALIQNQLTTGNPLKPPRPEVIEKKTVKIDDLYYPPPLWIGFFPYTFPQVMKFFWEVYGPLFSLLIIIGAFAAFRSPEVKYLFLGIPGIFILFYSCWVHLMARYMMIAQPFLIVLAVAGCGRLLEARIPWPLLAGWLALLGADYWARALARAPYGVQAIDILALGVGFALWLLMGGAVRQVPLSSRARALALVLLACFLIDKGPRLIVSRLIFQLDDAARFGRDVGRIVPKGSVIFATKPLTELIALFTSSYSIRPFDIERMGVSLRDGVNNALHRGVGLYLIDNLGTGKEPDAANFIPVLREDFDLIPVGSLRAEDYNLRPQFGHAVCTLYRIEPWSGTETEVLLPVASTLDDCILTLDARRIWAPDRERERVEVEFNGRPLDARIGDGTNFIRLPKEILAAPTSRLVLRSDRPLPRLMEAVVQDIWANYVMDLGRRAKVPDRYFISDFFDLGFQDSHFRRLTPGQPGKVIVPLFPLPDTRLIGEATVKNAQIEPRPLTLSVAAGGAEIASFDLSFLDDRRRLVFPLPAAPLRETLAFTADYPDNPRLGYREKKLGALQVHEFKIMHWLEKAVLSTPEKAPYFIAFTPRFDPASPSASLAARVMLNGSPIAPAVPEETVRLILFPEQVSPPESILRVVPVDSPGGIVDSPGGIVDVTGGRILIEQRPYLRRPASRLSVDIGSEEDWVFVGEGFYPPELHTGITPVRWTEATAKVFVPLFPEQGKKAKVVFQVIAIRPAASFPSGAQARLYLDGKDLGGVPLSADSSSLAWTIPLDFPRSKVAALTLAVPPWCPADYQKTTDRRSLGVMLAWVEVRYVSNTGSPLSQ
ncbi:MAG: hypothetical protein NTV79_06055 [Candidatus Aureabacteria bacterium]|nr:hypothetical protein [Candidatus Auribacterota bacterium]